MKIIRVADNILAANDLWAARNRKFLIENDMVMFNLIGSPGSGKTTLLERTLDMLKADLKIGVIEGDLETAKDARRISKKGVPVVQINTGNACHLDAHIVHKALKSLSQKTAPRSPSTPLRVSPGVVSLSNHKSRLRRDVSKGLIFVENIGNLVCPAEFDIGERAKIVVLSVPEGDDKVEKYPLIFSIAAALVISKSALLPHTDFKIKRALAAYKKLNPRGKAFVMDSLSGRGFLPWIRFLTLALSEAEGLALKRRA